MGSQTLGFPRIPGHYPKHSLAFFRTLSEFAARFEALAGIAAGDLPVLLRSAFGKLAEFSPVLGLELGGSRFLRRGGEFLAALPLPMELEPCT
jgi:hypothetical protein